MNKSVVAKVEILELGQDQEEGGKEMRLVIDKDPRGLTQGAERQMSVVMEEEVKYSCG